MADLLTSSSEGASRLTIARRAHKKKKASPPWIPWKEEIYEASSEPPKRAQLPTIQEIYEGYEKELTSDAEPTIQDIDEQELKAWIEGYERELNSDAEPTIQEIDEQELKAWIEGYEQELKGDEARGVGPQSFPCEPRQALHAVPEGKVAGLCAADSAAWSASAESRELVRLRSAARGHAVCHPRVGQRRAGPDAGQSECVEEVHPLPSQQHGLRAALGLKKANAEMPTDHVDLTKAGVIRSRAARRLTPD